MSANLDLVRSIYADWERGDFLTSFGWADDEIEFVVADGPEPWSWTGFTAMKAAFRERMSSWVDYRFALDQVRELDGERVLALNRRSGRGKTSGVNLDHMHSEGANLFHLCARKVTKLIVYWDRDPRPR